MLQSGIRAPLSSDCVGYVSIRAGLCIQTEWASCVSRVCLWIVKCLFYEFTWCVYSWTMSDANWIKWSILLFNNCVNDISLWLYMLKSLTLCNLNLVSWCLLLIVDDLTWYKTTWWLFEIILKLILFLNDEDFVENRKVIYFEYVNWIMWFLILLVSTWCDCILVD